MWSRVDNQEVGLEAAILERVRNSSLVKWFRADNVAGDYICPYFPYYPWYDGSVLESSLYGEYLQYYDVLNVDGVIDAQETARAYMTKDSKGTRLYAPNDARAKEKARLVKVMTKYYPSNFEGWTANLHASHFSIGIQRTACFTHWFSLSCRKAFSSPGVSLAELQAVTTLSMPMVLSRLGFAFFQTFGSVQSSDCSAP